jgi:hypothetical protein
VALAVGTTVKLARALWIVPLSVGTAMAKKSKARNLQRSRARRPRSDANQQAFFLWQAACHE